MGARCFHIHNQIHFVFQEASHAQGGLFRAKFGDISSRRFGPLFVGAKAEKTKAYS
jgi:hypothetical protein